jgi:segregation and condensation protein B
MDERDETKEPEAPEEAEGTGATPDSAEPEPPSETPPADEPGLSPREIRAILEALVFASPEPLTARQIGQVLGGVAKETWRAALDELSADYAREGRGLQLVEVAAGYQITTRPEYNDWVRELLDPKAPTRLSIQALETLAVIAYKQPVTLPEVIELRGVKSGGVVKTLLEKRLIRILGRKEVVGRPILYGTTKEFLLHFGLKDLSELPRIEEFAEVLGEEVDVDGLRRAIDAPRPVEVPLSEAESAATEDGSAPDQEASESKTSSNT